MSGFNPMQLMGMMGGGNNPMAMMMQMMQKGGNPQQVLMQMAQQNPQIKQIMPLIQGKNPQQLQQVFNNLCKERGVDPEQFKQNVMGQMQSK